MSTEKSPVKELITCNNHLQVAPDDLIRSVAVKMPKSHSSAAVVVDEKTGKLVGIITEQDIVERAVGVRRNVDETTVDEIMTKDPITISVDTPLTEALELLTQHGIRTLPIMEADKVVGILDIRDLYDILNRLLKEEVAFRDGIINYAYGDGYGAGYQK
ncbi:MAG: CBS domain-containing protein [Methyloligellaceae bacterium]